MLENQGLKNENRGNENFWGLWGLSVRGLEFNSAPPLWNLIPATFKIDYYRYSWPKIDLRGHILCAIMRKKCWMD